MHDVVEQFDVLTSKGFKVIPLWHNSKVPMYSNWNVRWSKSRVRSTLYMNPDANLGLLLGEIIDVEGDTPEANQLLLDLIKDYPHPSYRSSKSIHHLFRTPDPKLRILKHEGVEFRGQAHQSVLPPSVHQGVSYSWNGPVCWDIPAMPPALLAFYQKLLKGPVVRTIAPTHKYVWCSICDKKQAIHRKRLALELKVCEELDCRWMCRDCRWADFRPICRSIKRKYGRRQYGNSTK